MVSATPGHQSERQQTAGEIRGLGSRGSVSVERFADVPADRVAGRQITRLEREDHRGSLNVKSCGFDQGDKIASVIHGPPVVGISSDLAGPAEERSGPRPDRDASRRSPAAGPQLAVL